MFRYFTQRCDTFSHYKYPCCPRFLGEIQMWGCLKCILIFEWLLVLGEHMHHCGLSATVICKLSFSFDCIYLKICISLEVLQKCLWVVTELVGGQEARISDQVTKMKSTFFPYCIGWWWNCQVSIHQHRIVGITVIVFWKNHCLPSPSYCRWSGWDLKSANLADDPVFRDTQNRI